VNGDATIPLSVRHEPTVATVRVGRWIRPSAASAV
jgi:hypothetical protein